MPLESFATAPAALGAIMQRNQNMNQRTPGRILDVIKRIAKEEAVFIFSVGPWKQTIFKGTNRFYVPACPKGARLSEPVVVDGIVIEQVIKDEKSMEAREEDGFEFSLDMIGIGKMLNPTEAYTKYGLFVSRTNPPSSEEDLAREAQARAALDATHENNVREANAFAQEGPMVANRLIRQPHRDSALALRRSMAECPWMKGKVSTADRVPCPFCGFDMSSSIPKCPNCKEVVNQAAYRAAQEAARGPVAKGKGKAQSEDLDADSAV